MVEQLAFEACSRNSLAGVGEIHRRRERTHAALTKNRISMRGRDSLVGWLVSWCFKPSQPQSITSGLDTNFTLSTSYSFHKSSYHNSCFFEPIYIVRALNTGTCLRKDDLFYSAGLYRNHLLATANTGKIGSGLGKNAGE